MTGGCMSSEYSLTSFHHHRTTTTSPNSVDYTNLHIIENRKE